MSLEKEILTIEREDVPLWKKRLDSYTKLFNPIGQTAFISGLVGLQVGLLSKYYLTGLEHVAELTQIAERPIYSPEMFGMLWGGLNLLVTSSILYFPLIKKSVHRFIEKQPSIVERLRASIFNAKTVVAVGLGFLEIQLANNTISGHFLDPLYLLQDAAQNTPLATKWLDQLAPLGKGLYNVSLYGQGLMTAFLSRAFMQSLSYAKLKNHWEELKTAVVKKVPSIEKLPGGKKLFSPDLKKENYDIMLSKARRTKSKEKKTLFMDAAIEDLTKESKKIKRDIPYVELLHTELYGLWDKLKEAPYDETTFVNFMGYLDAAHTTRAEQLYRAAMNDKQVSDETKLLLLLRKSYLDEETLFSEWPTFLAQLEQKGTTTYPSSERIVEGFSSSTFLFGKIIAKKTGEDNLTRFLLDRHVYRTVADSTKPFQEQLTEFPLVYFKDAQSMHTAVSLKTNGSLLQDMLLQTNDHSTLFTDVLYNVFRLHEKLESVHSPIESSYLNQPHVITIPAIDIVPALHKRTFEGKEKDQQPRYASANKNHIDELKQEIVTQYTAYMQTQRKTHLQHNDLFSSNIVGTGFFIDGRYANTLAGSDIVHLSLDPAWLLEGLDKQQVIEEVSEKAGRPLDRETIQFFTWYHTLGLSGALTGRHQEHLAADIVDQSKNALQGTVYADILEMYAATNVVFP